MNEIEIKDCKIYPTGAKRSTEGDLTRFDLIPNIGLRRMAVVMATGAKKYGPNNWQKGMPIGETLSHAMAHINQFLLGDTSEDHLAHACCNLFFVMHFIAKEEYKKETEHLEMEITAHVQG